MIYRVSPWSLKLKAITPTIRRLYDNWMDGWCNYAIHRWEETFGKERFFQSGHVSSHSRCSSSKPFSVRHSSFRCNLELILVRIRFHGFEPVSFTRRRGRRSCVTLCSRLPAQPASISLTRAPRITPCKWSRTDSLAAVGSRLRTALCKMWVI